MGWVLIIFRTQVIKKNWPVRPAFPDYLSVSYDYDNIKLRLCFELEPFFQML